jgi:hypothetical protein
VFLGFFKLLVSDMSNPRQCSSCKKVLPVGATGDKCSLCAIGLRPASESGSDGSASRSPRQVQSRVLSGKACPHCDSELTLLDVSMGNCSICNGFFQSDTLRDFQTRREILADMAGAGKTSNRSWPDDAPIW